MSVLLRFHSNLSYFAIVDQNTSIIFQHTNIVKRTSLVSFKINLRWLDWIFLRGYLPSLSINYVGMNRDMEKKLPQLYYIKMKISYDLGFIAIGVAIAT